MNIQPMDWSATAAWIALVISIIGTIAGPIITTHLTNRHQLKLRELDAKEKELSEYNERRRCAIENFLSSTSRYLADCHAKNIDACGYNFFQVYAYAPKELWSSLDKLYELICGLEIEKSRKLFLEISSRLIEVLKEPHQ